MKTNYLTNLSIVIASLMIGGALFFSITKTPSNEIVSANNVSIVDGKQIIEIKAKGGFQPRKSVAKSGIPTVLRFETKGTFDCSSSIRIPSLNISKSLPQSGATDIDIGTQQVSTLQGMCGMGMYPFEIEFDS